jgi:hypothetical protein
MSVSDGVLTSTSTESMEDLITLCYCDGEFLAYTDATLTSAYNYDLAELRRGAKGTTPGEHLTGADFAFIEDGTPLRLTVPESRIGSVIYVKFASFNIYGGGVQDLADLTPVEFTPAAQSPIAPYNVAFVVL